MEIQQETFEARTYLVRRQTIAMQDIANPEMWQQAFGKVHDHIASSGLEIAGPGAALYFAMDPEAGTTDFGIGHPVTGATDAGDPASDPAGNPASASDLELATVGKSKTLAVLVKGGYMQFGQAHNAMWQHCEQNGLKRSMPVIEEYLVMAPAAPDESDWETKLYCLYE